MTHRKKLFLLPACSLLVGLLLAPSAGSRVSGVPPAASTEPRPSDRLPARLVLVVDGIPYGLFAELQATGHFAGFQKASRMISTFPSLSDVALAAIGGLEAPEGYQVVRYDRDRNRVVGNTIGSLSRAAHGFRAFDSHNYGSLHRIFSYLFPYRSSLREVERIAEDFLQSRKQTFVGYIGASDAILHVQGKEGGRRFLLDLESYLTRLSEMVRERSGRPLAIDLVSDHGSTLEPGRLAEIKQAIAKCGFDRARRLRSSKDVAYALAGILGSVAISCDPHMAPEVAACLLDAPGSDLTMFVRGESVVVLSRGGEAEVRLVRSEPETYSYRMLRGDPLRLAPILGIDTSVPPPVEARATQEDLFRATADADYPDPLRRVWRAFHGVVQESSDVLVSLRDGYEAGNPIVSFSARIRGRAGTHGSLTRSASLGFLASNWRVLPDVDAWSARGRLFGEETENALRTLGSVGLHAAVGEAGGGAAPHKDSRATPAR